MKALIIFAFFMVVLSPLICNAGDVIYLIDDSKIEGTVKKIDINSVTIVYGENDLIRTFLISEIKVIIFADGKVETFLKETSVVEPERESKSEMEAKVKDLEDRTNQISKKSAGSSGFAKGVGFCIVLLLVLLVI